MELYFPFSPRVVDPLCEKQCMLCLEHRKCLVQPFRSTVPSMNDNQGLNVLMER